MRNQTGRSLENRGVTPEIINPILEIKYLLKESNGQVLRIKNACTFDRSNGQTLEINENVFEKTQLLILYIIVWKIKIKERIFLIKGKISKWINKRKK